MFPCGAPDSSPRRIRRLPSWPPARMSCRVRSWSSGVSSVTPQLAIDTTHLVCYEQVCSDWRDTEGKSPDLCAPNGVCRLGLFCTAFQKEVQRGPRPLIRRHRATLSQQKGGGKNGGVH